MKTCPKMQAVVCALAEKHGIDLSQPAAHLRLDMPGFDRLVIEAIDRRRLVVAHYFEMNGDLVPDPSVTFFVTESGDWAPVGIEQAIGVPRSYVRMTPDATGIASYDADGQADLAEFVATWAQNIEAQAWLEQGTCTRSSRQDSVAPGWPEPTTERPDMETLMEWAILDGDCEATDGCPIEVDGVCPHGHPSWLLQLGLI
mgnify:CR=1 FL=1